MKTVLTWLKRGVIGLLCLILLAVATIYGLSSHRLNRRHNVVALPKLPITTNADTVAWGGHIATSFGLCTQCHGVDLGGQLYLDGGPLGMVYGPNLTRGRGGIGGFLTNEDWVRAIRYGVKRNGTSMLVMPSEKLAYLADDDLSALVSYLKQLTPVDREVPPTELRLLGRTLLVLGELPLLAAEKVPNHVPAKTIDRRSSATYGLYLANVGSCRGCHRPDLAGGPMQAPGAPPAPNLTPTHIGTWSEADFVRIMRTGIRPNGTALHAIMPWPIYRNLTDNELHAIWLYLKSVPPKPIVVRPS
ncbi:c-type cytochrome [Fibrella aquatilis]|uniref:C-type cytochrome n=1 Tax=Fibrella aquatilis TaxID=2817059 RepID=A0A939G7G8_9BACT|nr:c-type cytochrome [Fibrella aquatilis]MBO0931785.1 c-type cytochrome [Fibrella aquatilis]